MSTNALQKLDNFVIFKTETGQVNVEVFFKDDTLWLTQKLMAELFDVEVNTINYHLKQVFKSGELEEKSTIRKFRRVQIEGNREVERKLDFYNLDAIIAVGYRVNSYRATQFRIWATNTLREFIIKGFALDDERLKQMKNLGKDYFDELLERIREIRASERRFYQKITDIYATSVDYDPRSPTTRQFFATVQNKLHWAIAGQTAAEIIAQRADSQKENMGLKTWKNAPQGKILKSDTQVAKNYLAEAEIKELNLIISMYLNYAELQAKKQQTMAMKDWVEKLDAFLEFNDYEILDNLGQVKSRIAKKLAADEYKKFRVKQDQVFESDFDQEIKKYLEDQR